MTTLRVILDQLLAPTPGGVGRYTEELTRELIRVAPAGSDVAGIVPATSTANYERLERLLPGLSALHKTALPARELALAWQFGFARLPGRGMVHAPSLLAPLTRHDRINNPGDQTVVTIHDVVPYTHPESLSPRAVAWGKAMVRRAFSFADAVVVPTHAVAVELADIVDFGDRVRVIGGAVSPKLALPVDADARAAALGLPERYLLTVGALEPRKGVPALISSLADIHSTDLPLLVVGPVGAAVELDALALAAGLPPGRVRSLGTLSDADLAVALDRAAVFVFPSLAEGFGLPVIEAMSFGTPVVHSDAPAVVEVAAGAGLSVPGSNLEAYPSRLARAISAVLEKPAIAEKMGVAGLDRAAAFSWRDSAERVWQLHADL